MSEDKSELSHKRFRCRHVRLFMSEIPADRPGPLFIQRLGRGRGHLIRAKDRAK